MSMSQGQGRKKRKIKGILKTTAGSWGALGAGTSAIGHALKAASGQPGSIIPALFYGAMAGLSSYGIHKGVKAIKKSKKKKHKKDKEGDGLKLAGTGKMFPVKHIVKHMKSHPLNKPIHVGDLHQLIDKKHTNKVLKVLEGDHPMQHKFREGVKKKYMKAKGHLKSFFKGEKKYKPSDLLNHISMASGISSSFLGPELMIPSVAAKLGADYLKSRGQGLTPAGGSGKKEKMAAENIMGDVPAEMKNVMKNNGKCKCSSNLGNQSDMRKMKGDGLKLAGQRYTPIPTTKPYRGDVYQMIRDKQYHSKVHHGRHAGGAIKLEGHGKKSNKMGAKIPTKKQPRNNAWLLHVKQYGQGHPGLSYKECLKQAKKTYKRG